MTAYEVLWNGWRANYVSAERSRGHSTFTNILNSGLDDELTHIVHRSSTCFAIMNAYPYAAGHLLVVPYREVPSLLDLDAAEHDDLWTTVRDGVAAIVHEYEPAGVNVGINMGAAAGGSIGEHLHVHVVPRWVGDSNFMTAVAQTRTIPEALDASASRIRSSWPTAN